MHVAVMADALLLLPSPLCTYSFDDTYLTLAEGMKWINQQTNLPCY